MIILLVDDSRIFRTYMQNMLEQLGHDVVSVVDGHEAIQFFSHYRPDLVLLDVKMPGLDGYQVSREIRLICKGDWFPIIFISGLVSDEAIAEGIESGGDGYLPKPCSKVILQAKILAMQRLVDMRGELIEMASALKKEIAARKKVEGKLLHLSLHDPLTGLPNRRMYEEFSDRLLQRAKRHDGRLAFLALDLDHFKLVNDTLGHDQGDALLIELMRRFKACLREEDLIARVGGDEFMMLLEYSDIAVVNKACQRILTAIQYPFTLDQEKVEIGISIGVSFYPEDGEIRKGLQKKADVALYHAKSCGRNCVRDYADVMGDQLKSRRFIGSLQQNRSIELATVMP